MLIRIDKCAVFLIADKTQRPGYYFCRQLSFGVISFHSTCDIQQLFREILNSRVDSYTYDYGFDAACFEVGDALGQDTAYFFPVAVNIVDPFDPCLLSADFFNRFGDGDGGGCGDSGCAVESERRLYYDAEIKTFPGRKEVSAQTPSSGCLLSAITTVP